MTLRFPAVQAKGTDGSDTRGARPPLSIVVPTRDRPEMLARCLESIVAAMDREDELIVVDSASRDPDSIKQTAVAWGARVLRSEIPGAALARNIGWRAAANDAVAFVDDDVRVDSGWAGSIVRCLTADDRVGLVTGRIESPADQTSHFVAIKDDPDPALFDRYSRGMIGHSASMAALRRSLDDLGGFDVSMGPGARFRAAEDGDLFDRLLLRGHLCSYEPTAVAWHDQWREAGSVVRLNLDYGIGEGARLAKLLRTDRKRLAVILRESWLWCASDARKGLRHRNKVLLASSLARSAGIVAGFALGLTVRVEQGHFRARSSRPAPT